MLAQNLKTASDLRISEEEKDALCKVLVLLETGKLRHVETFKLPPPDRFIPPVERKFTGEFNMADWSYAHTCGTACCIGGTAEMVSGVFFDDERMPDGLHDLFYPQNASVPYSKITTEQAAAALRSYLTTGEARWDLAAS
jgi:hypothetical protein